MRGVRVSKASRKGVDLILIAARYRGEDGTLEMAQGYERRGPIWSDVLLLDRAQIVARLQSKQRVVTGKLAEVHGDFDVIHPVRLGGSNGEQSLVVGEGDSSGDDLQIPLF